MKTIIYLVLLISYIYEIKGIKTKNGMKISNQFEEIEEKGKINNQNEWNIDNEKRIIGQIKKLFNVTDINNNLTNLDRTINEHNILISKLKNQINRENTFLKEIATYNQKDTTEDNGMNDLVNSIISTIEKNRKKEISIQNTIDEIKKNSIIKIQDLKNKIETKSEKDIQLQKLENEGNYLKIQNNLMLNEINLLKKTNKITSIENAYFKKFNLDELHWIFSELKNKVHISNSTLINENELEIEKQISILSELKMNENNLKEQTKDIKEKIAQLEKQKDSILL